MIRILLFILLAACGSDDKKSEPAATPSVTEPKLGLLWTSVAAPANLPACSSQTIPNYVVHTTSTNGYYVCLENQWVAINSAEAVRYKFNLPATDIPSMAGTEFSYAVTALVVHQITPTVVYLNTYGVAGKGGSKSNFTHSFKLNVAVPAQVYTGNIYPESDVKLKYVVTAGESYKVTLVPTVGGTEVDGQQKEITLTKE